MEDGVEVADISAVGVEIEVIGAGSLFEAHAPNSAVNPKIATTAARGILSQRSRHLLASILGSRLLNLLNTWLLNAWNLHVPQLLDLLNLGILSIKESILAPIKFVHCQ